MKGHMKWYVTEEGIFGLERKTPETYSSGCGLKITLNSCLVLAFFPFGLTYYLWTVELLPSK